MSNLKLLHVIESLGRGGAETALVYLLPSLNKLGFACEVAVLQPPYDLASELELAGIPVHRLEIGREWSAHRAVKRLASLIRVGRYDVVHAHLFFAAFYSALTKPLAPRPSRVVSFHNLAYDAYPAHSVRRKLLKLVNGILMRRCIDAYVAVSARAAEHYRDHLGVAPITVIPNALADNSPTKPGDKAAIRARYGVSPGDFLMVMPARFVPEKGHHFFLEAVQLLRNRGVSTSTLLFGVGPLESEIRNQIRALKLENEIRIHLPIPRVELMTILSAADLFVMSSINEGFPLAPAEAMMLELPVLATAVGGVPELVEDSVSGILVEAGNPEALADAMARLAANTALRTRLGQAGRTRILENFTVDALLPRWQNFYDGLARIVSVGDQIEG